MTRHPGETIVPVDRLPRAVRGEVATMGIVLIAGVIGLTWLSVRVINHAPGARAEDQSDSNHEVRTEVRRIFVPISFVELAKGPSELASLESHRDVMKCLEERGLENAWYAIDYRVFDSSGYVAAMPTFCRPYEVSWKTSEFRAILATIQGNPPRHGSLDYSKARIDIIPEELANAVPQTALQELLATP